jgi:hypothetical protein
MGTAPYSDTSPGEMISLESASKMSTDWYTFPMFPRFADVIEAINQMKTSGLITDYAIGGAMAQVFWDEAIPTFDLDVLVLLPDDGAFLTSLEPIYEWARERSYDVRGEHIVISGIPVQFVPAPDALSAEAIHGAKTLEYQGHPMRVVTPEYLIAIWSKPPANTARRKERIAKLREAVKLDENQLAAIMDRHGL